MYVVVEIFVEFDYADDVSWKALFDENGNIKYNNFDYNDLNEKFDNEICFYTENEEIAKKYCEEYNKYIKLNGYLLEFSYCTYCKYNINPTDLTVSSIIELEITYGDGYDITIEPCVHQISNYGRFKSCDERISRIKFYNNPFIIPKENETIEELKDRCLKTAIEYIKNNKEEDYHKYIDVYTDICLGRRSIDEFDGTPGIYFRQGTEVTDITYMFIEEVE